MRASLIHENEPSPVPRPDRPVAATSPRELLSGIDALDLTCKSPAATGLLSMLEALKVQAGENPRSPVLFEVGYEQFRVAPSGMGAWWPWRLQHKSGIAAVGESANRPAWRVSLSAEALHTEGPTAVVKFWRNTLETLTGGPVELKASRLDVHADFVGLNITDADRPGFVCRSGRETVEMTFGQLETLYWGKGGEVVTRIYDKLAQVQHSGDGGYLLSLYGQAGLAAGEQVQRVEAQIRGDALRSLDVMSAEDAIGRAGEVYAYVVGKWLRLTDPSTATRRERAALDPRWLAVQAAKVAAGAQAAGRVHADRHAPKLARIVPMINGLLVAAGVALGVNDPDEVIRQISLLTSGYRDDNGRDFRTEVLTGRLEFGAI